MRTDAKSLDNRRNEIDTAREDALKAIGNKEQAAIGNFSAQRVTPEMLSESTKQFINASGGGSITNMPDDEDLTVVGDVMKFADREYNPVAHSGLGRIILRRNIVQGQNVLTQEMISKPNTVYEVRYDFDLNEKEISIPKGCTLQFEGGSLSNGTLAGSNTYIRANFYDNIFNNISFNGVFNVNKVSICWFGAKNSNTIGTTLKNIDCSSVIQTVFDIPTSCGFNNIFFPYGAWYISKTIELHQIKNLILEGQSNNIILENYARIKENKLNCATIYTNLDIDILNIDIISFNNTSIDQMYSMYIIGGAFDVSLCSLYNKSVIHITDNNNTAIWGFYLTSSILSDPYSRNNSNTSKGLFFDFSKKGFITSIFLKGYIRDFCYGIYASQFKSNDSPWSTQLEDYSNIRCRYMHYLLGVGTIKLDGVYQPSNIYSEEEARKIAVSYVDGDDIIVSGKYWDLYNPADNGKYTAKYAIEIGPNVKGAIRFKGFAKSLIENKSIKNIQDILWGDPDFYKYSICNNNYLYSYSPYDNFLFLDNDIKNIAVNVSENIESDIDIKQAIIGNGTGAVVLFKNTPISNDYIEITIDFNGLCYFDILGVVMDSCYRFSCSFKNVKLTLFNNDTITLEKTYSTDMLDRTQSINVRTFIYPIERVACNKMQIKFYNAIPPSYGGVKHFILYSIFARETTSRRRKFITSDGYGLKFLKNKAGKKTMAVDVVGNWELPATNDLAIGFTFFDRRKHKYVIWDDTQWVDTNGNPADAPKKGTTSQRPTGVQIGFTYKDTDLNKWIIWNGSAWENIDGTALA